MKVRIRGLSYRIVEEGDGENVYINEDRDGRMCMGLCDYVAQRIYVHEDLGCERKASVLRHELTHAFLEAHGITDGDGCLDEERVCQFMAIYGPEICRIADDYMGKVRHAD